MSFYNTGNPVPSIDPRDLDDNAKILDEFSNSTADTYADRLGVERRTLFSIEHDANSALLRSDLANFTDATKGAKLVGWKRSPLSDYITTVGQFLSSQHLNIWEYANLVTSKPTPSDPSTWDWTPAFVGASAAAITYNSLIYLPLGIYRITADAWTMFRTGGTPAVLDRQSTGVVGDGAGSRIFIVGAGKGLTIGQSAEGGTVSAGRNIILSNFSIELSANTSTAIYVRTASQVWIDKVVFHGGSFRDCQGLHIRDVITIGASNLYFRSFGGDLGTAVYIENPGVLTTGNYTFQDILALDTQKGVWAPSSGRGAGQVLNNIALYNFKVYNDLGTLGTGAGGYTDDGTYFTQRVGFDFSNLVYNVVIDNCHVEYKSGECGIRLNVVKNARIECNMLSGQAAGAMNRCVIIQDNASGPGCENIKIVNNYLQASAAGIYVGKNASGVRIADNKLNLVTTYTLRDATLLDGIGLVDREISTFTPTITGSTAAGTGTYTTRNGRFTRNQNIVTFSLQLSWTAHDGTGFLMVDGMPYAAEASMFQVMDAMSSNITFTGQLTCITSLGLARILPYRIISGSPIAQLNMSTSGTLYLSGSYMIK